MSKKEHPYAAILRWVADGETVEWQTSDGSWRQLNWAEVLEDVARGAFEIGRFRVKAKTLTVNGMTFPEPMRVAPDAKTRYYYPYFHGDEVVLSDEWDGFFVEHQRLARGLCHSTREAAEAHARALLSFTTTEQA